MKKIIWFLLIGYSCFSQEPVKQKEEPPQFVESDVIWDEVNYDSLPDIEIHTKTAKTYLYKAEERVGANFIDIKMLSESEVEGALKNLNLALKEGFNDPFIYFQIGYCQALLKNDKDAVFSFTNCLRAYNEQPKEFKDKTLKNKYFGRSDFYESMSDTAIIQISEAVFLYIQLEDVYYYRGQSKMNLQDDYGALQDFNKVTYADDDNLFMFKGGCKINLGDNEGAILDANKAILFNKNNCNAYSVRALAKLNLQRIKSACMDWSKSGELGVQMLMTT